MPFDGIVAKSAAAELNEILSGARIEKVLQPEADEIVLLVRSRWSGERGDGSPGLGDGSPLSGCTERGDGSPGLGDGSPLSGCTERGDGSPGLEDSSTALTVENRPLTSCTPIVENRPLTHLTQQAPARIRNYKLVLSASPDYPRIHLTQAVKENPAVPPAFCMLLRKHLTGGKIKSFEFNDYERIIGLVVEAANEMGDISEKRLVIEIMGRYSNIILLNSENRIIDSIKRVDADISSVREVMPARPYVLPPAQDKISPDQLDTAALLDSLKFSDQDVDKLLLGHIKGFSPLLCREICHRAGIGGRTAASSLDPFMREALKKELDAVLDDIRHGRYAPCVVFEDEQHQKPLDFHCLGIRQYEHSIRLNSISEALDAFYSARDNAIRLRQKKSDLYRVLNNSIDRCVKKLAIHDETLRDAADREKLKLFGELILANIFAIPQNASSVSLYNYYSENSNEMVDVPLDPNLLPQDNAQRYFKKYSKAKSAYIFATRQLEESRREMEYLESVLLMLDNCEVPKEIEEVRQELIEQGYLTRGKKKMDKKQQQALSNPLHFISSDGFDIYAGKNNRQNDFLALKMARHGDIWMHTKNIPGSHIIIKKDGREIPDRTLLEAAMLAAWHSRAKTSSNVQVDYTPAKNVSKPNGAKPGMVVYVNYRTAVVTPDKELACRLQAPK